MDGPLEYFHTHLSHFRLCVSEILWPSLMHVGPDTFLSSGLHGIAAVDHSSWILMRRISNLTSQGEFKLNVAAGMTYSSLRESRSRLCENHVGVTTVRGPGWNDPMTAVVPRVKGFACYSLSFSRHNKNIKMEHFFLYILSRYFI